MGGVRIHILLLSAVLFSGLAAMLPFAWSGAGVLESSYREYAVRDMTANSNLFAIAISEAPHNEPAGDLGALARTAGSRSDTRFTVVAPDGAVLADSDEDAGRMENHAARPEIREALAGNTGIDIRRSPTLGTEWIYVAIPHELGAVRAAASLDALNSRLALWWKKAALGFLLSVAVLAALALLASRALSRPIEHAAIGAERYAEGDLSYRPPITGAAEMRRLSAAMSAMAGQLDARFRLVTRQREEMRLVFENMSEGVLAVDDAGAVMLMNGAARFLFDLPPGDGVAGIAALTRNAGLLEALEDTRAGGAPLEREIRVSREHGERLVRVHTARICENGENVGVLAVLRDITELRRLETMRKDFVANVSHELKTPVTAIQSGLETFLDDNPADACESREFVDMALRHARRIGGIINNLLFLAGMESGADAKGGKTAVGPVRPVLEEAAELCREDAGARNIAIALECDDSLTALMNPQLVAHAVVNLLDNAVKYGPEGGTVALSARRDGDRTDIVVSDSGPGIAPRHQSRVFERFYRIDGVTRIKKGSGLGLAIVKHIALSQGGDIRLESEIGAGSRFILSLPRA